MNYIARFTMDKQDLLKFCRYYKGEKENPFEGKDQTKANLWSCEKFWTEHSITEKGRKSLAEYIDDYASVGLALFEIHDDIPASYKAMLFNRYAKTAYSLADAVEPFKKLYKEYYK